MSDADDVLLTDSDVESALSIAYVHAIAGHAGYTCGEPPGPDRDSVDIQISAGGSMRPKLDLQLKARLELSGNGDAFLYPLKVKNYDDLRIETQTPRILVVLDLPHDKKDWLLSTVDQLIIKRCAYWVSLRGQPASINKSTVTVSIPRSHVFDVEAVSKLMEMSRHGGVK